MAIAPLGRTDGCGSPMPVAVAGCAARADSGPAAGCAGLSQARLAWSWNAILHGKYAARQVGEAMSAGVLLVTGGSRGIGEAVAVLGAQRGYDIVLSYVSQAERAAAVVKRIEAAGGRALAV